MRASYKAYVNCINKKEIDTEPWSGGPATTQDQNQGFFIAFPVIRELKSNGHFMMCALMDYQIKKHADAEANNDGWFPCSIEDLTNAFYMTPGRQTRMLNRLELLGYIKRKRKGVPPLRYLWINFDKFATEYQKAYKEVKHLMEDIQ